ncbi:MAG: phosphopantetheine-binding protein [Planctomycetota bacterium]
MSDTAQSPRAGTDDPAAVVVSTVASMASIDESLVTMESDLRDDLVLDSLLALRILAALEKRFDVTVPDMDIDRLRTVGEIVELLNRLIAEKS